MEIEHCKECVSGTCQYHKWFTDINPQSDKDILISFLERISKIELSEVFKKVYIIENTVMHGEYVRVGGELIFTFNKLLTVHKKDGRYIPVSMCNIKDDVVSYDIQIKVTLMRHNPTEIIIKKGYFTDEILYDQELLHFNDSLHCGSITDYPKIVKLVRSRLNELINHIKIAE